MSTVQLSLFELSASNSQSIETKFQNALACLDSIPYINQGGCGLSALAIYRWCKKNGVEVSDRPFVVLCEDEWELNYNNQCVEEGEVNEIGIPHIVIEIDGELTDSEGTNGQLVESLPFRQEYQLSEDELLDLLNNHGWNSMFNRRKYRDIIALGLDVDLSDVDLW